MESCDIKPSPPPPVIYNLQNLGSNVYLHVEGDFAYVEKKQDTYFLEEHLYWYTEGQFITDGHRQFHATQSLFSFSTVAFQWSTVAYLHSYGQIIDAASCISVQHSRSSMQHSRTSMQHSRISMQHSRISLQHSRTSMQHSRICMQHSRISVQHSRISMQQRWPLSATVV